MGKLNLIIGPMYSGKSTELIRIYNKYKRNYKIITFNHKIDNRYESNSVNTHNKESLSCISVDNLYDYENLISDVKNIDIVLIDESQFFEDLYDFCIDIVENYNKIVYVFGLSGDSNRQIFGEILNLIPIADDIKFLKSICSKCKIVKDAPFTMRITKNNQQISVGSTNEYMAVCRSCWLSK
jgi:thymidine kinase